MKDHWWDIRADEVQKCAGSNNSIQFFGALKMVYGPSWSGPTPYYQLMDQHWTRTRSAVREWWVEHVRNLLNRPSSVSATALNQIPQQPTPGELDHVPSVSEIMKTIHQMNSWMSTRKRWNPSLVVQSCRARGNWCLPWYPQSIWEQEKMTEDFWDTLVIALDKNKGSKADCRNYRNISFLSIAGKIISWIILNWLITMSEGNLPEAQYGFHQGQSMVSVRHIQENCIEQNLDLYSVLINLTKAFDTVNREGLWIVLAWYGCPQKFIQIIRLFHVHMTGQVLSNSSESYPFKISNGMKQGCILAPVLFNLFFSCVLNYAVQGLDEGVYICYCFDGSIFNLCWLTAKSKTLTNLIQAALFGSDCTLMAQWPSDLQTMLKRFWDALKLFDLTISLKKTEFLFQPAPNGSAPQPTITIDGTELKTAESFKYFGSVISNDGQLDKEIYVRINKASSWKTSQQGTHTPQSVPDHKAESVQNCYPHITAL